VRAAEDVKNAKADIRKLLREHPAKFWTIREVQDRIDAWSGTIVSLALLDMRRSGELEMSDDLSIRVSALADD
jgi:hypothetical protein